MKKNKFIIIGILFFGLFSSSVFSQNELPEEFSNLIERAGMTFASPANCESVDLIDNPHMNYEYALRHKSGKLEIRYAIRPMDEQLVEHEKSKENPDFTAIVTPNDVAKIMYIPIAMNISGIMNPGDLKVDLLGSTKEAIKAEFGADDGVNVVLYQIRDEFSKDYKICMFISYWKENLGTACVFILLKDLKDMADPEIMGDMKGMFYSLKFK